MLLKVLGITPREQIMAQAKASGLDIQIDKNMFKDPIQMYKEREILSKR